MLLKLQLIVVCFVLFSLNLFVCLLICLFVCFRGVFSFFVTG